MRKFTLMELLVVIAILGILVSMLMPSLSKAREKAKIAVCASNERQIGIAVYNYVDDNNSWLPSKGRGNSFDDCFDGYGNQYTGYLGLLMKDEAYITYNGKAPNTTKCPGQSDYRRSSNYNYQARRYSTYEFFMPLNANQADNGKSYQIMEVGTDEASFRIGATNNKKWNTLLSCRFFWNPEAANPATDADYTHAYLGINNLRFDGSVWFAHKNDSWASMGYNWSSESWHNRYNWPKLWLLLNEN